MEKKRFTPPRALLSEEQYAQLSLPSRRLYASLWNQLSWLSKDSVTRKDDELALRTRILPSDVELARRELQTAGLLDIRVANSMNPDGCFWEYRIPRNDHGVVADHRPATVGRCG